MAGHAALGDHGDLPPGDRIDDAQGMVPFVGHQQRAVFRHTTLSTQHR